MSAEEGRCGSTHPNLPRTKCVLPIGHDSRCQDYMPGEFGMLWKRVATEHLVGDWGMCDSLGCEEQVAARADGQYLCGKHARMADRLHSRVRSTEVPR